MFELRDYAHDLTDNLLTGFAPPALEQMINTVVSADGVIVVTPIFSTSYSGLFKSFIDVLDPQALTGTPVLIGANAGTARHSLAIDYAIRPLFTYLHANPVPTGVFAASSDWGSNADEVAPRSGRGSTGPRASSPTRSPRGSPCRTPIRTTRRPPRRGEVLRHLLGGSPASDPHDAPSSSRTAGLRAARCGGAGSVIRQPQSDPRDSAEVAQVTEVVQSKGTSRDHPVPRRP